MSIHEGHDSPCSLDDLRFCMLYPVTPFAGLVALPPSTICTLLRNEELASPPGVLAGLIGLPNKCQTFKGKLGRVGEADSPGANPATTRRLGFVKIVDRFPDSAPGKMMSMRPGGSDKVTYSISFER